MSLYHENNITEEDEQDPVIYNLMEDIRCLKEDINKLSDQCCLCCKNENEALKEQIREARVVLEQYED